MGTSISPLLLKIKNISQTKVQAINIHTHTKIFIIHKHTYLERMHVLAFNKFKNIFPITIFKYNQVFDAF